MIYEMVLKDGGALKCYFENPEEVLKMMLEHSIYIVQENSHPEMTTYVSPDKVSHFRFPKQTNGVAEPVV